MCAKDDNRKKLRTQDRSEATAKLFLPSYESLQALKWKQLEKHIRDMQKI